MRLIQLISEMDGKTKIMIGTSGGSSWFYAGTARDLYENIVKYSDRVRYETDKKVTNARKKYEQFMRSDPGSIRTYHKRKMSLNPDWDTSAPLGEDFIRYLDYIGKRAVHLQTVYRQAQQEKKDYISLRQREVIDVSESDPMVDPGVTHILIKGNECGRYWMFAEAKETPMAFQMYGPGNEG